MGLSAHSAWCGIVRYEKMIERVEVGIKQVNGQARKVGGKKGCKVFPKGLLELSGLDR